MNRLMFDGEWLDAPVPAAPPRVRMVDATAYNAPADAEADALAEKAFWLLDPKLQADAEIISVLRHNNFTLGQINQCWHQLQARRANHGHK